MLHTVILPPRKEALLLRTPPVMRNYTRNMAVDPGRKDVTEAVDPVVYRTENIRRIAEVVKLMNDAGLIVLTAFISPFVSGLS